MIFLVCIGEKIKGVVNVVVDECSIQVEFVMVGVEDDVEVVFVYEFVWVIGVSEFVGYEYVFGVVEGFRNFFCVRNCKGLIWVVYGGSVGFGLYEKLSSGFDGFFLGRFGYDLKQFVKIIWEVVEVQGFGFSGFFLCKQSCMSFYFGNDLKRVLWFMRVGICYQYSMFVLYLDKIKLSCLLVKEYFFNMMLWKVM